MTPDIRFEDHGSIWIARPETPVGTAWLEENTDGTWFGAGLVVEPRYVEDLYHGADADGLEVTT